MSISSPDRELVLMFEGLVDSFFDLKGELVRLVEQFGEELKKVDAELVRRGIVRDPLTKEDEEAAVQAFLEAHDFLERVRLLREPAKDEPRDG